MKKSQKGFTLIEILFSITVLIAILSAGVFSLSSLMQKNEQQSLIDELQTAIQYAKIEARVQNQMVFLKAVDPQNWAKGMVLVCGKTILHRWRWYYGQWQMTWKGVHSSNRIFLSPNPLHAMSNGRFHLQHSQQKNTKMIILNRMGRIKVVP